MASGEDHTFDPELIEAYLLGHLTDEQAGTLEHSLRQDPAARQQFAQASEIMSLVRDEFRGRAEQAQTQSHEPLAGDFDKLFAELLEQEQRAKTVLIDPDASANSNTTPHDDRPSAQEVAGLLWSIASDPKVWAPIAAVVTLALTVTLVVLLGGGERPKPIANNSYSEPDRDGPTHRQTHVATLTAERDAVWSINSAPAASAVGAPLHASDRLTLTQGFAEITTNDGAIAILEAPATVELLDNSNALRLYSGKLVGICETESSKGFLVRTAQMDITDLGTRFGVDATEPGSVQTHVLEGVVEVARRSFSGKPAKAIRLVQGQAALANADQVSLQSMKADSNRFASLLPRQIVLPGTGHGLAQDDLDHNWQVIAADGQRFEKPQFMLVGSSMGDLGKAPDGTAISLPLYGQGIQATRSGDQTVFTLQTTFELPADVDPNTASLVLQFVADERVDRVRLNGRDFKAPSNSWDQTQHAFTTMRVSEGLQRGTNVIELDVVDFIRAGATKWILQVQWHLEEQTIASP